MKKKTGLIIFLSSLFVFLMAFIFILFISEDDYARITEVDYQAVVVDEVDSRGKVVITERLTFDVHAASDDNLFWELWRELPEMYVDGVKVDYNVLSVKQIMDDGTQIIYPESPQLYWWDDDFTDTSGELGPGKWFHSEGPYDDYYNYESLIFYMDGVYRDRIVFEIQYEMFNAVLRYQDSSELYLAMYSGPSSKYLEKYHAEVLVPSHKMPRADNYTAYTYGTNSHQFPFEESDTLYPGYHTFSFSLDDDALQFKSYNEYIEFSLIAFGEDKHRFSEFASINNYSDMDVLDDIFNSQKTYANLPHLYQQKKTKLFLISVVTSIVVLMIGFLIHLGYKRKYKLYQPTQRIDYFRDIPSDLDAGFVQKLVFSDKLGEEREANAYAAAMLSLVHKGYLSIEKIDLAKKENAKNLQVQIKESNERLSSVEKAYYDLIKRHTLDNTTTLKTLQDKIGRDYEYASTFKKRNESLLNQIGVTEGYLQKTNYKAPKQDMIVLGVVMLIVGVLVAFFGNVALLDTRYDLAYGSFFIMGAAFILMSLSFFVKSRKYVLLTQFGQDEKEKWRALYDFLNNETLMVERGVQDLVLWEKYLIYATVFGISEKVIKALKLVLPKEMIEQSPMLRNNRIYYSHSFRTHTRALPQSAHFGSSYATGSGSHSGVGGGGRGGGGGGGGH